MDIQLLQNGLDSLGQVNVSPQPYEPGRILSPLREGYEYQSTWDPELAYDEALAKSAMVDRCVTGLAEKAASLPLRVWERKEGSSKPVMVSDHEMEDVLNYPSSDPVRGSREELVTRSIIHNKIIGHSFTGIVRGVDILKRRGSTKIVGLEAEDPRQVYPIPDKVLKVRQWNYRDGDGRTLAWNREDLSVWKRHNPRNSILGRSVLQSLALTVDSSVETSRTHLLRVVRDGRPGLIISDESIQNKEQRIENEDILNARQRTNRGGIMLLGGKTQSLVSGGMSSEDLGILESMAYDRDMIAIAFGYLPAGFSTDSMTYNNSGIFVLHEWGLVQQNMSSWCSVLASFLFSPEDRKRFLILPDYSEVQALSDANMEGIKTLTDSAFKGVSTNDLIRALGLPLPLQKGGDEVLVPANLQKLALDLEKNA